MAHPGDTLAFDGQHARFLTFKGDASTIVYSATAANGSAQVGLAAKFASAGDGTVELTTDGCRVLGPITQVTHDNFVTVQVGGVARLKSGSGATITEGAAIVGDLDGSDPGYIRAAASGTAAELILCGGYIIEDEEASDGTLAVWLG